MENNNANSNENNKSENQHDWIFTILSIPNIGGLLTTIIALAPASVLSLLFILIAPADEATPPGGFVIFVTIILLISMLLVTWWWLNYMEKRINLAILLPIPVINIPIKWLLVPFMLPFFGLRWIYQKFTTKSSSDNSDSPE